MNSKLKDSLVNRAREALNESIGLSQKLDEALNELVIREASSRLQNSLKNLNTLSNRMNNNLTWIKGFFFIFLKIHIK